jgi:hypothetical protein
MALIKSTQLFIECSFYLSDTNMIFITKKPYDKLCNEQVTYMYDKHQALMKCGNLSHDILQSVIVTCHTFKLVIVT